MSATLTVRAELVEALFFSLHRFAEAGRAFDKLRPSGGSCPEISA
nr:hypothetical protein [Sphingomonas psychrotolerans]